MAENNFKQKSLKTPIEKHDTAAWASCCDKKPVSNVNIPEEFQVRNAKKYVDTNEK